MPDTTYVDTGITPGTEAWRAIRKYALGASDIGWIVGDSPYGDSADLWEIKTDRASEIFQHPGMTRGLALEDEARKRTEAWFRDHLGMTVNLVPRFIRSTVYTDPPIVCSLDGDDRAHDITIELKVPYESEHAEALLGRIPPKHAAQLQTQFMVRQPKHHYFVSFDPDVHYHELAVIEVQPDLNYQAMMLAKIAEFVKHLKDDTRPTSTKAPTVILDERHGKGQFKLLADTWLKAKDEADIAKAREQLLNEDLKAYLHPLGTSVRGCGVIYSRYSKAGGTDYKAAIKDGVITEQVLLPYKKPASEEEKLLREKDPNG